MSVSVPVFLSLSVYVCVSVSVCLCVYVQDATNPRHSSEGTRSNALVQEASLTLSGHTGMVA